jgi:hypothetical protein
MYLLGTLANTTSARRDGPATSAPSSSSSELWAQDEVSSLLGWIHIYKALPGEGAFSIPRLVKSARHVAILSSRSLIKSI